MTITGGTLSSNVSLSFGLDADKPDEPKEGEVYVATDIKKMYVCYVDNEWVDLIPLMDYVYSLSNETLHTNSTARACASTTSYAKYKESRINTLVKESSSGLVRVSVDGYYDNTGSASFSMQFYINGVSTWKTAIVNANGVVTTLTADLVLNEGDLIQVYCKWNSCASGLNEYISNLKIHGTLKQLTLKEAINIGSTGVDSGSVFSATSNS